MGQSIEAEVYTVTLDTRALGRDLEHYRLAARSLRAAATAQVKGDIPALEGALSNLRDAAVALDEPHSNPSEGD